VHIVVIHHWAEEDPAVVQRVAEALGVLVFDVRQRMLGGGPVVIASFADPARAVDLTERLAAGGIPTLLIDTEERRAGPAPHQVLQFSFEEAGLRIQTLGGQSELLPYAEVRVLLSAMSVVSKGEAGRPVIKRKFSLGKTLLAGGIPMTKKVKQEVKSSGEERDEVLCLISTGRPVVYFLRGALNYAGLGSALQLSRVLNFTQLKSELVRRIPQAVVDERLLKRAAQVRLLGPSLDPDIHFELACEILARTLV